MGVRQHKAYCPRSTDYFEKSLKPRCIPVLMKQWHRARKSHETLKVYAPELFIHRTKSERNLIDLLIPRSFYFVIIFQDNITLWLFSTYGFGKLVIQGLESQE